MLNNPYQIVYNALVKHVERASDAFQQLHKSHVRINPKEEDIQLYDTWYSYQMLLRMFTEQVPTHATTKEICEWFYQTELLLHTMCDHQTYDIRYVKQEERDTQTNTHYHMLHVYETIKKELQPMLHYIQQPSYTDIQAYKNIYVPIFKREQKRAYIEQKKAHT